MPETTIVNIVATADLGQQVNLVEISELPHTIFDNEIYGGRVAYLKKPGMYGKVSIFPSGKLISVGTRRIMDAESDLQETADTVHHSGLIRHVTVEANIRNIVAVIMTKPLALEEVAFSTGAIYEPEQFPAAILKTGNPERTYLIFNSGKIVLPGLKTMNDLDEAVKQIRAIIDDIELT